MSRISKASAFLRWSRKATASIMPVRGDPVLPSKKATRQPVSSQWAFSAALLAASAARAFANALMLRRVRHAFNADSVRLAIGQHCIGFGRVLLDLFARPSTGPRLACSGHAAEVIRSELPRRGGTALVPHDGSGSHLGLADQVIGEDQCRA